MVDIGETESASPVRSAREFSVEHDHTHVLSRLRAAEKQLRLAADAAHNDDDRQDCVWLRKKATAFIEDLESGDNDA